MGWTQSDFEFAEPRYFFNAIRGRIQSDYEAARLVAYYSSQIHASKPIKLHDFGYFPWEKPRVPIFREVDKAAFDRIANFQFPSQN